MARNFTEIAFTPSVRREQERNQSRRQYARMETGSFEFNRLTDRERHFIEARDTFFMATVGENGWPYIQHRGGPKGFLKVLDERTLGFADFRGNRQYISVGNLRADDRVALILIDYATRRRLKLWARAEVIALHDNPDRVARLADPEYGAKVERGIVLRVEALDWNCPQHITPRFTEEEVVDLVAPLAERIRELEARLEEHVVSQSP